MLDDPVSLVWAVAAGRCLTTLAGAYAERLRARARAELLRAASLLPAGVELGEQDATGGGWATRTTADTSPDRGPMHGETGEPAGPGQHGDDGDPTATAGRNPATKPELEEAYRADLVRFARRCAADRGLYEAQLDAEGVAQEAFALALRHWDTIDNPRAWLFTVARRLVGKARAQAAPADTTVLDGAAVRRSTLVPRASAEDAHAAREVMAAIGRLRSDRQRAATYLRHVEGRSLKEIAEVLGCAPATAGVHIYRGTDAVRDDVFLYGGRLDQAGEFFHRALDRVPMRLATVFLVLAAGAGLVRRELVAPAPGIATASLLPLVVLAVLVGVYRVARTVARCRQARIRYTGYHRRTPA